jgi:cation:H+ antiporter
MLWKGADWLVDSAAEIAHTLKVSDLIIGLTVVAFGTSAPEFAVTISAAVTKQTDISIGNVIGSNIFNLGFILGGTAIIRPISTNEKMFNRDGLFLLIVTALIFFLFFGFNGWTSDDNYTRIEGLILFSLLIGYITFLFIKKDPPEEISPEKATIMSYAFFFIGLILIVLGGHLMVTHASNIARFYGISDWVIAVTIVAAGTSAPEFATSIAAAIKGRHGIAIGNLIGSDLFNLLGVLGLAGIINPSVITQDIFDSVFILVLMVGLTLLLIRTKWKISRAEGALLVSINLIRWYFDFAG